MLLPLTKSSRLDADGRKKSFVSKDKRNLQHFLEKGRQIAARTEKRNFFPSLSFEADFYCVASIVLRNVLALQRASLILVLDLSMQFL